MIILEVCVRLTAECWPKLKQSSIISSFLLRNNYYLLPTCKLFELIGTFQHYRMTTSHHSNLPNLAMSTQYVCLPVKYDPLKKWRGPLEIILL